MSDANTVSSGFETNIVLIPVDKIKYAEWNYKEQNSFTIGKLKANLKRNGQIENLIVREIGLTPDGAMEYECVNGNHRLQALIAIGCEVAACYNLGTISEIEAKRIAVETNETRFKTNEQRLGEILDRAEKEYGLEELLETMPYDEEEVNMYIDLSRPRLEDVPIPESEAGETNDVLDLGTASKAFHCPKCGHEW
jgi:ParB-like chromosome segregation protein Spo0J